MEDSCEGRGKGDLLEEKEEGRVQGETNGGLGVVDGFLTCACAWMWVEGGRQEENILREITSCWTSWQNKRRGTTTLTLPFLAATC